MLPHTKGSKLTTIEGLRRMVNYFNSQNETFNSHFTYEELLKIWAFVNSKQGGRVHECADQWPNYLLNAVLKVDVGEKVSEKLVIDAGKEC